MKTCMYVCFHIYTQVYIYILSTTNMYSNIHLSYLEILVIEQRLLKPISIGSLREERGVIVCEFRMKLKCVPVSIIDDQWFK